MIWSFFAGGAVGAFAVLFFYARLFRKIEPAARNLIGQREQLSWEKDAAVALYKGAKHDSEI